ncbi:TetR/AcrR family transcriptional regulator [Streptomyces sp. NPDC056835]|uniref:TetR/AcrR family transcriptional regulator n=1 Tax=Streptomyces sp. NPDC056835 TaxID=3345956 RepID=UPI003676BDC0
MSRAPRTEAPAPQGWRDYAPLELDPVLSGALSAFHEHGYHGTTVRDIARRVGVTVPALYYHYENKQALLVALLDRLMRDVLDRCRAATSDAGDDPVERFSLLVESIVLYMANRRKLAFLDTEIRSLEPENHARYVALRDYLEHTLVDTVVDGVEKHAFSTPYPADACRAVLAMCQGVANWYRPGGPLTPTEIARRYVDFCLGTVGYTGPPRAAARPARGRTRKA